MGACSQVEGRAISESEDEDEGAAAEAAAQAAAVAAAQADGANVVLESASRPSAGTDPGVMRVEWYPRVFLAAQADAPTSCWRAPAGPARARAQVGFWWNVIPGLWFLLCSKNQQAQAGTAEAQSVCARITMLKDETGASRHGKFAEYVCS